MESDSPYRDPMTGLWSRRYAQEMFEGLEANSDQEDYSPGMILIDVDHLKRYNDQHNHAQGDQLLRRLADTLSEIVADEANVCRIGGDEFLLIYACTSSAELSQKAEEIRQRVAEAFADAAFARPEERSAGAALVRGGISVTCGIAVYPKDGTNFAELMRSADDAIHWQRYP